MNQELKFLRKFTKQNLRGVGGGGCERRLKLLGKFTKKNLEGGSGGGGVGLVGGGGGSGWM